MKIARSVVAVLTVALLASGGGVTAALVAAQPAHADSTQLEIGAAVEQILRDTNAERVKAGLGPLLIAPTISAVAQNWSAAMDAKNSLSHNPEYPWQMPQPWIRVGENVAQGYIPSTVVAAWMASPGHKANILGDFTHIGLGYWVDDNGRGWFTQNFGKYEVVGAPTIIDEPVTTAGKFAFTSTWTTKSGETVNDYRVDLRSSTGLLLQSQSTNQPAVSFAGLTENTGYIVEVTARAFDVPGLTYVSPARTYTVTTLEDLPEAMPEAVTFTDMDGTQNDTFTIPLVAGIDYLVDGAVVPAGIHPGAGTVMVTARARAGYTLAPAAVRSWSATFKATPYIATPTAVTFSDRDGTQADTYTVPAVTGIDYLVGGNFVLAGTYPGAGTVTVTARAWPDYVLDPDAPTSWSTTFKATPYTATPAAVMFTDVDGTENDTFTVPAVAGVDYLADGNVLPAGTYPGTGTVTVTARAQPNYVLSAGSVTSWSATFQATPYTATPASVTFNDVDGTQNDTFTIPSVAGVDYLVGGNVLPPGTYPGTGTVTVTARAQPGYVLAAGASSTWTGTFRGSPIAAVPTITGAAKVGYTLTANPGAWGPAPVAFSYQWHRAGIAIAEATAATYSPTAADIGKTLTVRITGSKAGYGSTTQTSAASQVVASGSLVGTVPRITGTAKVGYTLTATPGTWGPAPVTLSYQWYRSGVAITGATAATYRPAAADITRALSVRVTGSKAGYASSTLASASTAAIVSGSLLAATPRITGTAKVGYTLTAVPGSWGPAPVTLRYQWFRSGVPITGATAAIYKAAAADVAKSLTVRVTGSKPGYSSVIKASAATTAVTKGTLGAPTPRITGTARVGYTLTVITGAWTPAPVTLRYQWYRSGVAIAGATGSAYRATVADLRKTLTVRVTGSKAGYVSVTRGSAATALVAR